MIVFLLIAARIAATSALNVRGSIATATSFTHALGDLAKLGLVDKTVAIAIRTAEALIGLLAGHACELFLADFAIAVAVGTLHELSETTCPIAPGRRSLGLAAFLGVGKTNAKADEAEANDE